MAPPTSTQTAFQQQKKNTSGHRTQPAGHATAGHPPQVPRKKGICRWADECHGARSGRCPFWHPRDAHNPSHQENTTSWVKEHASMHAEENQGDHAADTKMHERLPTPAPQRNPPSARPRLPTPEPQRDSFLLRLAKKANRQNTSVFSVEEGIALYNAAEMAAVREHFDIPDGAPIPQSAYVKYREYCDSIKTPPSRAMAPTPTSPPPSEGEPASPASYTSDFHQNVMLDISDQED